MHVYILQRPDGLIKVGFSTDPTKRLRNLETQGGFDAVNAWVSIPSENAKSAEHKAHESMADRRVIGEWFNVEFDDALNAVLAALAAKNEHEQVVDTPFNANTLAARLVFARKAAGMRQEDLAKASGVGRDVIAKTEIGITKIPRGIEEIAAALNVSPAWLAFGIIPAEPEAIFVSDILAALTKPQRAQALRMLEAFAASCAQEHAEI